MFDLTDKIISEQKLEPTFELGKTVFLCLILRHPSQSAYNTLILGRDKSKLLLSLQQFIRKFQKNTVRANLAVCESKKVKESFSSDKYPFISCRKGTIKNQQPCKQPVGFLLMHVLSLRNLQQL